jgi:hypothetical protein
MDNELNQPAKINPTGLDEILTVGLKSALEYDVIPTSLGSIWHILGRSADYMRFNIGLPFSDPAYVCLEHSRMDHSKLPDAIYLPNLPAIVRETGEQAELFGCTIGHHQDMPFEKRMQGIYEFKGFGAILIDNDNAGSIDLVVASPGEKIIVPNRCNITIYNLDSPPLATLAFANPAKSSPSYNCKNTKLQEEIGPAICAYRIGNNVTIALNAKYVAPQEPDRKGLAKQYGSGVIIGGFVYNEKERALLGLDINESVSEEELQVSFAVGHSANFGAEVYAALFSPDIQAKFRRINVNIVKAVDELEIKGVKAKGSLLSMLARHDRLLQRHIGLKGS